VAAERILDHALGQLFAQALVAIARADDEIGPEEGRRLEQRIAVRVPGPFALDDLLLADPLEPHRLAESLGGAEGGPFRSAGLEPGELAAMIVADGIAVVIAKGYVAEAEAREIVRFASALGCSLDQIRAMCGRVAPWLGTLVERWQPRAHGQPRERVEDRRGRPLARTQPLGERLAVDHLHSDEVAATGGTDLVHGDHVGMGKPRHRAGLAKPLATSVAIRPRPWSRSRPVPGR